MRERGALGRAIVGIGITTALAFGFPAPAGASITVVSEFPVPTSSAGMQGVTLGPDGNVWFAEKNANKIGRMTPDGVFTEFPLIFGSAPTGITAGPDGALWFTESARNRIGRITTDGAVSEFAVPTAFSQPTGIAAGPDGALWFTQRATSGIGRVTTGGAFQEFETSIPAAGPFAIVAGSDGAMWFTEQTADRLGRIAMDGTVTETPLGSAGLVPTGITAGPDGALWFTERAGNSVDRMTTDGDLTRFPVPTAGASPTMIAGGPDGELWFTEYSANQIGSLDTSGTFHEVDVPTDAAQPFAIASGAGSIWFTEQAGNSVARASMVTDTTPPTVTINAPADGTTFSLYDGIGADYSCADEAGGSGLASCVGDVPLGWAIDTDTYGPKTFSVTATDVAGNTTTVTHSYVVADTTPPTVTLNVPADGATYTAGSVVQADFSCEDEVDGSGIASCAAPVSSGANIDTSVGTHTFTVLATDVAGNTSSATSTYTVPDTVPPTIALTTPADGSILTQGSTVKAKYACADEPFGSGLATCVGTVANGADIDTTYGSHSFTVSASDVAGNTSSVTHTYTVPDTTAPAITFPTPADGAVFSPGNVVRADYSCADERGGSGLAACNGTLPNGALLDMSLGSHSFTVSASDVAGNTSSATHTYRVVDATPPTVTFVKPADGATFPMGTVVRADYACADEPAGSGLASCVGTNPAGAPIDMSLGSHTFTVVATDVAGNTRRVTHTYTAVDTTAPTVTLTTPVDGTMYAPGQVVLASFSCADDPGGSGIASCKGSVANGAPLDTTVGAHSFTVTAKDNAGNVTTVTRSYVVFASLTGPIGGGSQNAGRSIPVGFALDQDRGRNPLADGSPTTWQVDCAHPGTALGPVTAAQGTLNGGGSGKYTYNWRTSSSWANTCRVLSFTFIAPGWVGAHADFLVVFGS